MSTSFQTTSENVQPLSNFKEGLEIQQLYHANLSLYEEDKKDVIQGLTQQQKSLPPRFFYDDYGSQLFEKICDLPEYYPTRTEAAILEQYAPEIAQMTGACELVELGSGSSTKTRLLLNAYQDLGYPLHYVPIDVSAGILETSAKQLLKDYPSLRVHGLVGTYEEALQQMSPTSLPGRMIFFLGSTLGNFTPQKRALAKGEICKADRFFSNVTHALAPGEYFLLGIDLQKPKHILEAAYNDAQGVTAAFNLNMLNHLNERFQGNFNLDWFEHWAFYNEAESQIEMHLKSTRSHSVRLESLDLTVELKEGETIHTEISRKFDLEEMQHYLTSQGLNPLKVWTDSQQWFGVILAQA